MVNWWIAAYRGIDYSSPVDTLGQPGLGYPGLEGDVVGVNSVNS